MPSFTSISLRCVRNIKRGPVVRFGGELITNYPSSIIYVPESVVDRSKAWTPTVPDSSWLKKLLPTAVPTARILAFGYNFTVGSMSEIVFMGSVRRHAGSLLQAVAQLRESDVNEAGHVVSIYFRYC